MEIRISQSSAADLNVICQIQQSAFGHAKEAELSLALLGDASAEPRLSLLAWHAGTPAGHIIFSRAYAGQSMLHILAPLAVMPEYQKNGIGGMLINEGIKRLRTVGAQMVFVLGHKEYYPRYGFKPHALKLGFLPPFDIKPEHSEYWMYLQMGDNLPCPAA